MLLSRMTGLEPTTPAAALDRPAAKGAVYLDLACARLKSAGWRITQPRLTLLAALIRAGEPRSIDALHQELGPQACDVVTVYRCMAAFESIGIVRRAYLSNGTSLYELDLGVPMRYHVVCKTTQRVFAIDPADAADLGRAVERIEESLRRQGYSELGHLVEFFGISPSAAPADRAAAPAP
jgi:Fur family ferric uptake transcriptional regulator